MKIVVVGLGYVGLSNAVLLSRLYDVVAVDISEERVTMINNRISPLKDTKIEEALKSSKISLRATTDSIKDYKDADYAIIAVPTNFDETINCFDTSIVDSVVDGIININKNCKIIIKSTVPIGYTESLCRKYNTENIMFSPEFLQEGKALHDCLYPSRIVVGGLNEQKARRFGCIYKSAVLKKDVTLLITGLTEAEAIKMFSNSYLAMRVAYFNELDSFSEKYGLNTYDIIEGVCLDPRINNIYNNPSFGYGGYCFPKDTKQLASSYNETPNSLISSIVSSNKIRKNFISDNILNSLNSYENKIVGIYRLIMKSNSDNFRESAIFDIIDTLNKNNVEVIIYEPTINKSSNYKIINDLNKFKNLSSIIVANRYDKCLDDVNFKVYTRDIYGRD